MSILINAAVELLKIRKHVNGQRGPEEEAAVEHLNEYAANHGHYASAKSDLFLSSFLYY